MAEDKNKILCIPFNVIEKLKKARQENEFLRPKNFLMLSDKQRIFQLTKYVDRATAEFINDEFEKSRVSLRKNSLKNWSEKYFGKDSKQKNNFLDYINQFFTENKDLFNSIDNDENLSEKDKQKKIDNLINFLVKKGVGFKEGFEINQEVSEKLNKFVDELNAIKESDNFLDEFGNYSSEFFKKQKEIIDYLRSQNPSSNFDKFLSTWGRLAMLASVKSPIVNIISNAFKAGADISERTLTNILTNKGMLAYNGKTGLVEKYIKQVWNTYKESGYDISRMQNYGSDLQFWAGEKTSAKLDSKIGKWAEEIVFKYAMGAPDVLASAFHFANTLDQDATAMAKKEGLTGQALIDRAKDLFMQAARVDTPKEFKNLPDELKSKYKDKTKNIEEIAKILRARAIKAAHTGTFTGDSLLAKTALKGRDLISTGLTYANPLFEAFGLKTPKFLGETFVPFVKVPANIIAEGINYSGGNVIKAFLEFSNYMRNSKNMNESEKYFVIQDITRKLVITLGIYGTAMLLLQFLKPDDFYDEFVEPEKGSLMEQEGARRNSIKLFGNWISLDYFGPVGIPLVALMYWKKYDNLNDKIIGSSLGVLKRLYNTPGIKELAYYIGSSRDILKEVKDFDLSDKAKALGASSIDFMWQRTIPAIFNDFTIAFDKYQRQAQSKSIEEKLKIKIPFVRMDLPEKIGLFGEKKKGTGFMQIISGSRFSSDNSNFITTELERLNSVNEFPRVQTLDKISNNMNAIKKAIGNEKFNKVQEYFGQNLKKQLTELLPTANYKELTDSEKKEEINQIVTNLIEEVMYEFNFWDVLEKIKKQ